MLVNLAHSNRPSLHRVTLLAVGSELPLMNVRMAIGTSLAHIGEDRPDVTLRARHVLVHAAQGELSLVVIKFGNRADRLPSCRGMAVLARHIQIAMRAVSHGAILTLSRRRSSGRQEHDSKDEIHSNRRKHVAPSSKRIRLNNKDCLSQQFQN